MVSATPLPVNTVSSGTTAMDMANLIFGNGATVSNATYNGDALSSGIYSGGDTISPRVTPGDTGVIMSTGFASQFTNASGEANQFSNTSGNTSGDSDTPALNTLAGASTFDAATLDIDFEPDSAVMTMDFVFSSEEYPEFQNSVYQDFVAVWVNGDRILMEVGNGDIDPGNVNTNNNINMYVDNQSGDANTEMDGFTITLSLTMNVNVGFTNSLRISLADVGDSNFDSNLLISADAVQTDLIAITDSVSIFPSGDKTLNVLANDLNDEPSTLTITQINGVDVLAGDIVVLPTGQSVQLSATGDGTLNVIGDGDVEDFNFTYTIDNGVDTDVGFVNASSIPCFVVGTMIATPDGEQPAETLRPGDLVLTKDEGPQPLRWIGTREVTAEGRFAPIHILANTFGSHRDLLVSPLHRVLIRDNLAELLFGEAEVLVAARDLINDRTVRRRPGGQVTYVHLLFDRHQVVFSEGLETESFLPGPQTTESFEQEVVDEICTLFPEIDPDTGLGYSAAARRMLKRYEAELLRAAKVA